MSKPKPPRWIHHARSPQLWPAPLFNVKQHTDEKPCGLWVSDDNRRDSWRRFVKRRFLGLVLLDPASIACDHEVVFHGDANLLELDSFMELKIFTEVYGFGRGSSIRWAKVAKDYDGILITPFVYDASVAGSTEWYAQWDCASGCIWNPRAIKSFTLVAGKPPQLQSSGWAACSADQS